MPESASSKVAFFPSLCDLPDLSFPPKPAVPALEDSVCYDLWKMYEMPSNIARHSALVASIAYELACACQRKGCPVDPHVVRQSGLLHDLGKQYSLRYGGAHAQLGAAWVVAHTGHYAIAQGVMHHVFWPWAIPQGAAIASLPILVLYADKRAKHDMCVTLEERASDLLNRYGKTQEARDSMRAGFEQIERIEQALATFLGWEDLHAYSFDRRRLVN